MSARTVLLPPADHACAACPWRTVNHRRHHPAGWYTDANRRRLWGGLRTGAAPGMTCHPTDPDNEPDKPKRAGIETRECAGAWLLVVREIEAFRTGGGLEAGFAVYRRGRPLPMTRVGMAVALAAMLPSPFGRDLAGLTLTDDPGVSLGLGTGR